MRRLIKTILFLALAGYVIATGLPLVQAHSLEQLGDIKDVASEQAARTSVGALIGNLRSLDLTEKGLSVTTADGRDFNVDMDLSQMTKTISQPSGNNTGDITKYGAIGFLLTRLLGLARRVLGLITRVLHLGA